jgi:hypothetical protein
MAAIFAPKPNSDVVEIDLNLDAINAVFKNLNGCAAATLAASGSDLFTTITLTLLSMLLDSSEFSNVMTLTLCPALTSALISVTTNVSDGT